MGCVIGSVNCRGGDPVVFLARTIQPEGLGLITGLCRTWIAAVNACPVNTGRVTPHRNASVCSVAYNLMNDISMKATNGRMTRVSEHDHPKTQTKENGYGLSVTPDLRY